MAEGIEKPRPENLWMLLTFLCISYHHQPPTSHNSHSPVDCPRVLAEQQHLTCLLSHLVASQGLPTWLCGLSSRPWVPCASHRHGVSCLYYDALLLRLPSTIPDWELLQAGEHVLLMAESAGLVLGHHTVNLLNEWTNNWIHAPLPSVFSNQESKGPKICIDYNDSFWISLTPGSRLGHFSYNSVESCLHHLLTWFYLCFCSRKMQQLSQAPGDGSPCGTEQMAPSLESIRPVGEGLLCFVVTSCLIHNLIFSKCKGPTATLKDILSDIQFNN